MVHFRTRLDKETMTSINEMICRPEKKHEKKEEQKEPPKSEDLQDMGEPPSLGVLKVKTRPITT